ncbi:MAG TPA: DUF4159 domain-containing protein, partial [Tepidisphaeraceae bacterium]|nr:DUF4159 domain-containing protein [Tepidisphaeraceae bacterium]
MIALVVLAAALLGGLGTATVSFYRSNQAEHVQRLAKAKQLRTEAEQAIARGNFPGAIKTSAQLDKLAAESDQIDVREISQGVRRDVTARAAAQKPKGLVRHSPPPPAVAAVTKGPARADDFKPVESSSSSAPPKMPGPETPPAAPKQFARASVTRSFTRESPPESAPEVPRPAAPTTSPDVNPYPVNPARTRPAVRPVRLTADTITDEQIGKAITRGIDHLMPQFDPKTHLLRSATERESINVGLDILCVYALMQCQQATNDPRLNPHGEFMIGVIEAMKRLNLNDYHYETYARGLRATALALYNRPEDREVLKQDAAALVKGSNAGGYTYVLNKTNILLSANRFGRYDNSNSQYGLLGVWSAAEAGFEVPDAYWAMVQQHWFHTQMVDGQWPYNENRQEGTHSMTCAGLASLFVTHDYLDLPKMGSDVGRDPFTPQLAKGLSWLERGANSVELNHGAYDLYGLERVGLASGFKFFGNHEWYRELAAKTIARESNRGGYGGDVETAYSLLFLARGRHPILMNKVRFDGYWANRPRDVANLARFVGYQLERQLNWQVVPLKRDWTDWMDSPILYISSHKTIKLSQADYGKIRQFVENGGMLFMQADGGAVEFNRFAHEASKTLFPQYEMTALPANHPLCSVLYKIKPNANLHIVTNGSRILMLYAADDESKYWQMRDSKNKPFPFQLGTNMFVYAAGKRDLRNHLSSTYIPPVHETPTATYKIARLSYPGNWNPEPEAWHRFSRWFHLNTGYELNVVELPIKELKPDTAPVAQLTGTAAYDLTADEAAAIKQYVQAGGVLLVDLCGGTGPFDKSVQSSLFFKSFADTPSHVMSPSHPMLTASGNGMEDLSKPLLRQYAIDVLGSRGGLPEEIASGKGHVIFTSLDLTTGLLGTSTWGILGYEPAYAQSLVKN